MQKVVLSNGCTLDVPDGVVISVLSDQPGPDPGPGPGPDPGPTPPPVIPGMGYQQIPCPNGQKKYDFNGPMTLDLLNQPTAKPGGAGFIKTAPQIGGDTDAGPAITDWTNPDGSPGHRDDDAPVTIWYGTDQPGPNPYFYAKVGSTIRLVVPNPTKPWFLDYKTPNA